MAVASSPPGRITFGQQLRSREAGGFTFVETLHASGFVLGRHAHECANFNLTLRGECRETVRGRSETCGPSSLVIKPPGESHANRYGPEGARCLIVEIGADRLRALGPRSLLLGPPLSLSHGPLVGLATRMYQELRSADAATDLLLEGMALEFLGLLERREATPAPRTLPPWLRQARERIHAAFTERLGLTALAELSGVDASYFARTFRRWFGCTVGEYVRRLRLELAAERLAASDAPLAEVAQAAGFYDQSHFTKAFKRHLGQTPAQYRSALRSSAPRSAQSPTEGL